MFLFRKLHCLPINHLVQCCRKWGFIPTVGILRGLVSTIFFKWGLKFLKCFEKSGEFLQNVGIFSKIVGMFKKSEEIFAKCGDFWEETLVGTSGDF